MHLLNRIESRNCIIALPPSGLMGGYLGAIKKANGITAVVNDTPENILERSRVLSVKFGASAEMIQNVIRFLKQDTIFPKSLDLPDVVIQDQDDLLILASALAGKAEVLITGDKEWLTLGSIYNIEIISPRQFWEKIVGQPDA